MDKTLIRNAAMLHPSEIMQPYDTLLNLEGFDAIYALADQLGGLTIYMPTIRSIFARCIEREVLHEFNGNNFVNLAKKYGFSERHLRRILGYP